MRNNLSYCKRRMVFLSIVSSSIFTANNVSAQIEGLTDNTNYFVEMNGTFSSGDVVPFGISSNKYGLSSIKSNSGYIRGGFSRSQDTDSLLNWRYGYGIDLVAPFNYTSKFVVQQAYGIVQYKNFKVTVGAKETPSDMLNDNLSSGELTLSNNFRPIPQVRIELPNWWHWHFTNDWVSVKGHISYGMYTDWNWQEEFTQKNSIYTRHSLFHSKAGYLRICREDIIPLSATIGLQMASQFGGYGYNIKDRNDNNRVFDKVNLGNGIKSFWNAFFPGGNDVNDGDYNNVEGNQTGNWYFDLKYLGKGWSIKAYAEHFFEDHSQLFVQYGWKDMLWGIEASLPHNHFVDDIVVEYLKTDDQTGGLYHDQNELVPDQISGKDNYYNHHVYGAWQHWGQAMGNPILLSPIYNNNKITFYYNRVNAFNIALSGSPLNCLNYTIKYSYLKTLGTYDNPTLDPLYQNYFTASLKYVPSNKKMKGWSVTGEFGINKGDLIDNSTGFSVSLRKTGLLF